MGQVHYAHFSKKGHFLHARVDYLNIFVAGQIRLCLLNHIRVSVNRINLSLWHLVAENFGQITRASTCILDLTDFDVQWPYYLSLLISFILSSPCIL